MSPRLMGAKLSKTLAHHPCPFQPALPDPCLTHHRSHFYAQWAMLRIQAPRAVRLHGPSCSVLSPPCPALHAPLCPTPFLELSKLPPTMPAPSILTSAGHPLLHLLASAGTTPQPRTPFNYSTSAYPPRPKAPQDGEVHFCFQTITTSSSSLANALLLCPALHVHLAVIPEGNGLHRLTSPVLLPHLGLCPAFVLSRVHTDLTCMLWMLPVH